MHLIVGCGGRVGRLNVRWCSGVGFCVRWCCGVGWLSVRWCGLGWLSVGWFSLGGILTSKFLISWRVCICWFCGRHSARLSGRGGSRLSIRRLRCSLGGFRRGRLCGFVDSDYFGFFNCVHCGYTLDAVKFDLHLANR